MSELYDGFAARVLQEAMTLPEPFLIWDLTLALNERTAAWHVIRDSGQFEFRNDGYYRLAAASTGKDTE
jgi:hypothetical protein